MTAMAFPWLSTAIATLAIAGIAASRTVDAERARRFAIAIAFAATVLGVLAAVLIGRVETGVRWTDPVVFGWIGEARPLFALDDLNGALLPLSAGIVLALLVGSSRSQLDPRRVGAALGQLAATWTACCALDLAVLAVAWIAGVAIVLVSYRSGSRVHVIYLLGSSVALVIAFAAIVVVGFVAGVAAPASLLDLERAGLDELQVFGAVPLLLVAIMARKGATPLHSWIPAVAERLGPRALVLLAAPQVGALVLVRVAMPLFPATMADALPILARVALVTAVYGAVLGLVARDLRRAFGWLVVSQSAYVLVGLECTNADGIAGALTLWISVGLAHAGLALAISAVEARVGPRSLDEMSGVGARAPWLGAAFLVLGLASVGLPGSLGFIAEDLLVHGVLESYPGIGAAIVVATAANGFTVMRCTMQVFYGPPREEHAAIGDVLPRERLALAGLAIVLFATGLMPEAVVAAREATAQRLAAASSQVRAR